MRCPSLLVFALCALSSFAVADNDEQATRDTVGRYANEWNKHDATGMAATFAEDGTVINPYGATAKGRPAIQQLLEQQHATVAKQTSMNIAVESVRMIKGDVALVDATIDVTGFRAPDGKPLPGMKNHATYLLLKKDGKWWIADARVFSFTSLGGEQRLPPVLKK